MKRITHSTLALGALALFGIGSSANATTWTFFPNDATIDYPITADLVIVGYANLDDYYHHTNPTNPRINIVSGGNISGTLYAYHHSIINVSNSSPNLTAHDFTTLNFGEGSGGSHDAHDFSTVNINSGSNLSFLTSYSPVATINCVGGEIGQFIAYDGIINISAGLKNGLVGYVSAINFFGTGLKATFDSYDSRADLNSYYITGKLTDGNNINLPFDYNPYPENKNYNFVNTTSVVPAAGKIILDGIPDLAPATLISFEFRTPGTSPNDPVHPVPALFKTSAILQPDADSPAIGNYTLPVVAPGTYDIAIQNRQNPSSFGLRKVIKSVTISVSNGTIPQTTLFGGDADGNNVVNFDDFLVLLNAFGGNLTSGYYYNADFNSDGKNDFNDFLILLDSFGMVGDL